MDVLHIALSFDHSRQFFRDLWAGVQEYALHGRKWNIVLRSPAGIRDWSFAGLITYSTRLQEARTWRSIGPPVVDVAGLLELPATPTVAVDWTAVGELAANYFLERHFRRFGHYFELDWHGSPAAAAFARGVQAAGGELTPGPRRRYDDVTGRRIHQETLDWLGRLTAPAAILVQDDMAAQWLIDLCRLAGRRVPEDIAILGIGNDPLWCEGTLPAISSLELPGRRLGFEAARRLDELMAERSGTTAEVAPPTRLRLPPVRVVTRHSTDAVAIEDRAVANVLRHIREHVGEPFSVVDLARLAGLNRRMLERRFRTAFGHSPLEAIHLARVERAKELLTGTDANIPEVAELAGFSSALQFRRVFRRLTGQLPATFAAQTRLRR